MNLYLSVPLHQAGSYMRLIMVVKDMWLTWLGKHAAIGFGI